jgi:catechol 2,3-dioxygenase-like lactoylglutathione lyase family enzyme
MRSTPCDLYAVTMTRIKTVIRCMDYTRSRHFYVDVLGLPLTAEWDEPRGRGGMVALGEDGLIEIDQMTAADPRDQPAFHQPVSSDKLELQIQTDDLDAWALRLTGAWPFDGPITMPWGERRLILRDPDGVLVSICQAA